jgi:hypothetical protein
MDSIIRQSLILLGAAVALTLYMGAEPGSTQFRKPIPPPPIVTPEVPSAPIPLPALGQVIRYEFTRDDGAACVVFFTSTSSDPVISCGGAPQPVPVPTPTPLPR